MKISLITPAHKQSLGGNRTTAVRWARILGDLGHRVDIALDYDGSPADAMVALHAWRSASSIARFRALHPGRPLIVALTGTDIYRFIDSHESVTLRSIALADRLVALHDLAGRAIPAKYRAKLHIIYQSALPLARGRTPVRRHFDVCVIGHLRDEKDSMRTAYAARLLPEDSKIRVTHLGRAHDDSWAAKARAEMARNRRYRWRGEVPGWAVRRAFAKTRLMVLSSKMEGGANVISEAVVAGVPVIASRIPGSVGLLGADYPGYYPVGDHKALARVLRRAEVDAAFLKSLAKACKARAPLFTPKREVAAWRKLLREIR